MKNTKNTLLTRLRRGARLSSGLLRVPAVLTAVAMALTLLWPAATQAARVHHGVAAANLQVDQIYYPDENGQWPDPLANENTNALVTTLLSINDFRAITSDWYTNAVDEFGVPTSWHQWWNRADYQIQIGPTRGDDITGGVMMAAVAQNGRNNYGVTRYPVCAVHDGWRICTFANNHDDPLIKAGDGYEYNVNVAGAWFPYPDYIGALVRNSERKNGQTNDMLIGHSSLVLGQHFYWWANGRFIVDLRDLGFDSRTDGVMITTHGKDEQNFALSQINTTNGTWTLYTKDMSQPTYGNFEQDPVAFVFIPKTNTMLISGMFNGDGSIVIHSGDTPQFTVRPKSDVGAGRWELKIPGHSPASGVLIISACAGGTLNTDNIVSYEPDGDGWEIQSRDTPGMGLQTPKGNLGEPEPVCTFVFIPAPTPGITVTPTNNLVTSEDGGTAQFTVELDFKPTADVTIGVSSSNPAEGVVDVTSLTFTPNNWNIPQVVTITGQDDAVADGQVAYTIVLAKAVSADPQYHDMKPADVAVLNADNEAGITVSKNWLVTTEAGGTDSFTVVLNTAPTADVTIGLASSDVGEGTVFPASLVFTPDNWNIPQTVTVTGVDDVVDDGDAPYAIVFAAAVSADAAYNGVKGADVPALNLDNDEAGIIVTPQELTVSETGTTANFTVVLGTRPTADVVISYVSGDPTEGVVTPASRTFTPDNWNTPQTFTVTGVDDAENDGDITYNLQGSVTSSDAVYAAMIPAPILVTTLDDEAELALPSGPVQYGIGTTGIGLDGWATLTDSVANYNGGNLTVVVTNNGSADDRLTLRNEGVEEGQVGVSGANVTYSGIPVGTLAGGEGLTPLVVTFNNAVTPAVAQALVRAVTFSNVAEEPSLADRTVTVIVNRGAGSSAAEKLVHVGLVRVTHFQEGADHGYGVYTGAQNNNLWALNEWTAYPEGSHADGLAIGFTGVQMLDRAILLRFDDIIGEGPGQIPPNATIVYAEFQFFVSNNGDGSPMYRMLIPWTAEWESWGSLGDGVQLDDSEARSTWDSAIGVPNLTGSTGTGRKSVAVTADVQAWANGEDNYGWYLPGWDPSGWSGNWDFWAIAPSQHEDITRRPSLLVKWVPEGTLATSFRYGVNDYTATYDSRVRSGRYADEDGSTAIALFPDWEINTEADDRDIGLIRFEEIIGEEADQVPPGATIHSAQLDIAAFQSNSPGNGFYLHYMLQPWNDTDTWNMLGDGVQADGVKAAVTPTAILRDFSTAIIPYVPGGYHSLEVKPDVQAWAYKQRPNYGWVVLPFEFGRDGFGFGTAEHTDVERRPQLRVFYSPGEIPEPEDITLTLPVWSPSQVVVGFNAKANTTYTVQRVGQLGDAWQTIGQAMTDGDGHGNYEDKSPLAGAAFYRVVLP